MSKYTKIAEIARLEALRRFEKAARTDEDFHNLTRMYDKFDENRERRERYNEILCPTNEVLSSDYNYGTVIPPPLSDPYWRELMRGKVPADMRIFYIPLYTIPIIPKLC